MSDVTASSDLHPKRETDFVERFSLLVNEHNDRSARLSIAGRNYYVYNIFTERLWVTIKHMEVYLADYETLNEAR